MQLVILFVCIHVAATQVTRPYKNYTVAEEVVILNEFFSKMQQFLDTCGDGPECTMFRMDRRKCESGGPFQLQINEYPGIKEAQCALLNALVEGKLNAAKTLFQEYIDVNVAAYAYYFKNDLLDTLEQINNDFGEDDGQPEGAAKK